MSAFMFKPEFEDFINKKPDKYWKPFIDLYNELELLGTVNVSLYELYELWKHYVLETECDNNWERYYSREIFNGVRLPESDDINDFAVWLSER